MKKFIVITTINPKSEAVRAFEKMSDWHVVLVGDRKTPHIESTDRLTFLSLHDQESLGLRSSRIAPLDHYSRKNIGFLLAIRLGADVIYETDDDNYPYEHWGLPPFTCDAVCTGKRKFINIYRYFSEDFVWPRGFPLDEVLVSDGLRVETRLPARVGVWQGLTNLDPDVDAIFRLVHGSPVRFLQRPSIVLRKGFYCPFNSQNTFWHRRAFPLLYLPVSVNSRCSDILRGYIAQRLLWPLGVSLGFTSPSTFQIRNMHNLTLDFEQEIPLYLFSKKIVATLEPIRVSLDPLKTLRTAYEALALEGLVAASEIESVDAWKSDIETLKDSQDLQ